MDSLIAQIYPYWEAILVDDGSKDNSLEICREYAERDIRFRVIHQENQGVSITRQRGLDQATGEYVIGLDADDWMEPDMLEVMHKAIRNAHADVAICHFYRHDENGAYVFPQEFPNSSDSVCTADAILKDRMHGSTWNKLVSMEKIKLYHCEFVPHIDFCEDVLFLCQLFQHHLKVTYLQKAYYHYICDTASGQLTTDFSKDFYRKNYLGYARQLCEWFSEGPLKEGSDYRLAQVLWKMFYKMNYTGKEMREMLHGLTPRILSNKYIPFTNKIRYAFARGGIRI